MAPRRVRFLPLASIALAAAAPAQQSALQFDAPQVQLWPQSPALRALLDLDGDGDLDGLGIAAGSTGVRIELRAYPNAGQGVLAQFGGTSQTLYSYGSLASYDGFLRVATGDLDGDGDEDLLFSSGHVL